MKANPANLVPLAADPSDLGVPAWAAALLADAPLAELHVVDRTVIVRSSPDFSLVSVRIHDVDTSEPGFLKRGTDDAYTVIAAQLAKLPAAHPVRFWNYIPGIHQPGGTGPAGEPLDRYMSFNAGRFEACRRWLGGEDAFPRLLATASGVGHGGRDLVVHALAAATPGVALENPRQVPAYRYSHRYGPKPPCFARATILDRPVDKSGTDDGSRLVMVGGTASVRGEASVHVGDLTAQMAETLENLTALLGAAAPTHRSPSPAWFDDVRVYHVRTEDLPTLKGLCGQAFPRATIEYVQADLCRQDLLVEIEGVATIPS